MTRSFLHEEIVSGMPPENIIYLKLGKTLGKDSEPLERESIGKMRKKNIIHT